MIRYPPDLTPCPAPPQSSPGSFGSHPALSEHAPVVGSAPFRSGDQAAYEVEEILAVHAPGTVEIGAGIAREERGQVVEEILAVQRAVMVEIARAGRLSQRVCDSQRGPKRREGILP